MCMTCNGPFPEGIIGWPIQHKGLRDALLLFQTSRSVKFIPGVVYEIAILIDTGNRITNVFLSLSLPTLFQTSRHNVQLYKVKLKTNQLFYKSVYTHIV